MDIVKDIIKLFLDNSIAFCHPHGLKNNAQMNAYILAKDLPKVQELLSSIRYEITDTEDGNFIISIS